MVNAGGIKRLLDEQPFRAFEVTMSSGERFQVPHPEVALLTRRHLLVGLKLKDGVPADYQLCSLLHITSIKPLADLRGEATEGDVSPVSSN